MLLTKNIIKFRKKGRKKYVIFEIVVASSFGSNSKVKERIGFYNPHSYERRFFFNSHRLGY